MASLVLGGVLGALGVQHDLASPVDKLGSSVCTARRASSPWATRRDGGCTGMSLDAGVPSHGAVMESNHDPLLE